MTLVLSQCHAAKNQGGFSEKVRYSHATILWSLSNLSEFLEDRRVEATQIKRKYRLFNTSVN